MESNPLQPHLTEGSPSAHPIQPFPGPCQPTDHQLTLHFPSVSALPFPGGDAPPPTPGRGGGSDFCLFDFLQKPQGPEQGLAPGRLSVSVSGACAVGTSRPLLPQMAPSPPHSVPPLRLVALLLVVLESIQSPEHSGETEAESECVRPALPPRAAGGLALLCGGLTGPEFIPPIRASLW